MAANPRQSNVREQGKAHSGRVGAQEPGYGKSGKVKPTDKKPNSQGPQYEEGGRYPGTREAGADADDSDARMAARVLDHLANSGYDVSDVSVSVIRGFARLDGSVPDERTRHEVERSAGSCCGVRDVENHMRVQKPEVPGAPGSTRH